MITIPVFRTITDLYFHTEQVLKQIDGLRIRRRNAMCIRCALVFETTVEGLLLQFIQRSAAGCLPCAPCDPRRRIGINPSPRRLVGINPFFAAPRLKLFTFIHDFSSLDGALAHAGALKLIPHAVLAQSFWNGALPFPHTGHFQPIFGDGSG